MSVSFVIITSALIIMSFSFTNIIPTANTHAESFQSSEQLQFTLNPTISISISGNLTIESLVPGDAKDSNIITVIASSNASAGYTLTSTVGTIGNTSNELRKGGTDTTNKFTNLTANVPALNDAGFHDNEWGYSYAICSTPECTNEPTWISGNTGSTLAGYDGYDYNTTTSTSETITHLTTTTSGSNAIKYKIGAKSSATQLAGEYTNAINFVGIANPNPTYITLDEATYMQDSFSCTATKYGTVKSLIDNRDNQSYLVAKANDGNCWMIENLKIGKTLTESGDSITLTPANSNVNDNYILNFSDIPADGKFHAYTVDEIPYQNNSNEWICRTDWDSCYYNWYTATAGAGTTAKTSGSVDTSICPAGWSLPSRSSGQFRALYNQYPSVAQMEVDNPKETKNNSAGKIPGFLLSGLYNTGGAYNLGFYGYYWSRTALSAQLAYLLYMDTSVVDPANSASKYYGFAVRCIAN